MQKKTKCLRNTTQATSALTGIQHQQNVSSIDASLSDAVLNSSKLTMRKSYVTGNITGTTITAEKNLASAFAAHTSTYLWSQQGFFKNQRYDAFAILQANLPELTIFYLNQGSLHYKNDQKIFYGDHFILGQVIPLAELPADLSSFKLKSNEVKLLRPKYNVSDGKFLGLIETIGYITVRGDPGETFFDSGYDKKIVNFCTVLTRWKFSTHLEQVYSQDTRVWGWCSILKALL